MRHSGRRENKAMALSHFNASRRRFLTALVAGATLHRQRFLNAAETDPRLARVLANTISIDMHSHIGIPFGNPNAPLPQFDLPGEGLRGFANAPISNVNLERCTFENGREKRLS